MAVGRISGPLLKDNLLRNGVNLAFETNLLYLDVQNSRVGIKTIPTQYELEVNGTTRTTNLYTSDSATLGLLTFSGSTVSSTSNTITFTPSGINPTIYQGTISVGNLNINTNTIAATGTNTDINVTASGTGTIKLNNNVYLTGNLHVTGNVTADGGSSGNIQLGNQTSDTISFTGEVNTDILPDVTNTHNLGSNSLRWANVYATTFTTTNANLGNVTISGNTISTSTGNLILTANGAGSVVIQGININNNVISSTATNANIVLTPQGTGSVTVNSNQSLIVPVGTTAQQPGTAANGMVRYNTDNSRYEGYSAGYWTNLGGVQSIDGNTRITPESTPGTGDNIIRFYANNILTAYIDSTKLYATDFRTSQLDISGNTISALSLNTDINLITSGTGGVVLGNLRFATNSITNVSSNAVTQIVGTGNGYFKIGGTFGVVIPVGATGTRPIGTYTETGMMRFNTEYQYVEVFNGTVWANIAGSTSGVTTSDAQNIGIQTALAIG
jgi:hypothetical protein